MPFFAALIHYDGQYSYGFQRQPKHRSIQQELEDTLNGIFKHRVVVLGSGRTDSGVHALGQVISFQTNFSIGEAPLLRALNAKLPPDVRVVDVGEVNRDFHPIFSATGKEYFYFFGQTRVPFFEKQIALFPYELDWKAMQMASECFLGEHDFADFRCRGTDVASTIRRIDRCVVGRRSWETPWGQHTFGHISVQGSGFLKQMVRLIVGSIWQVGRGQLAIQDLKSHLDQPRGRAFSLAAPAQGLYLSRVFYPAPYGRWVRQD